MAWVLLGPPGVAIAKSFHLNPAQKGFMVAAHPSSRPSASAARSAWSRAW
jgi:nitrate/nitrite transporter NarK